MQRFFLSDISSQPTINVNDMELYSQITKVLRLKVGDNVIFFNGKEMCDYEYTIQSIEKKSILFSFCARHEKNQPQKKLALYQALPNKLDKLEDILQKGTEVGYESFHIFRAERSQDLMISENKRIRLEKIIQEACEQSGRNTIPELHFYKKTKDISLPKNYYVCHTQNVTSQLLSGVQISEPAGVFVGPEGGFSPDEIEYFQKNNGVFLYF